MDISKDWKKAPRKILVFQTAFLGDALLCIPLLKAIKLKWPQSQLGFVCRKGVGDLFLHGIVDQTFEVSKSSNESLKEAFKKTKSFEADLIISPHQSFRTALWVWRLRPSFSVGFKTWWNFFAFSKRITRPMTEHDVLRQLSLMSPFNGDTKIESQLAVDSNPRFAHLKKCIVFAPGSQWNTKRWMKEKFTELAKRFEDSDQKVVLIGAPDEGSLCQDIAKELKAPENLCGKTTIVELAQVLKDATLLVGNDSGAMHVAAALGIPVVSIFGPTTPQQGYSPWSKYARVVEVALPCRPCGAHGHQKCPLGTHDCMKLVTVEEVWEKAQELLGQELS